MLKVVGASWNKIRASTWIIGVVFVFGIIVVILGELGQLEEDGKWAATVYWSKESGFEIVFWGQGMKFEDIPKGAARAYYQSHLNQTGWAVLDIETQAGYPDWVQAFGAGMLEGSLSWQMVDWQRHNTITNDCRIDVDLCEDVKDYLEDNMKWVKEMYVNISDPYWHQIYLFYLQLEGVQKGFEQGVKRSRANDVEEMTLEDFLWLNSMSDISDLKYKLTNTDVNEDIVSKDSPLNSAMLKKLNFRRSISYTNKEQNLKPSIERLGKKVRETNKCGHDNLSLASALVKLDPDNGELFIAHNSAGQYSTMLKMLKHYHFSYRKSRKSRDIVPGTRITFSSYPGVIHSMDDFFIVQNAETDHELVLTATPLPVYNEDLWDRLSPAGQVFIGPRVMAANRLASDGESWSSIVSKYNSGTGNKEWLIVDFSKFKQIADLRVDNEDNYRKEFNEAEGILYVAEQIPGCFQVEDITDGLRRHTYWASYGLPYFKDIADVSGVSGKAEESEAFSYEKTPLAKIFSRDHVNVTDIISLARLMRSNFYKTDPLSNNNPRCAVGGRGDLPNDVQEAAPVGVTDTKIYSNAEDLTLSGVFMTRNLPRKIPSRATFQIKAGPPYSDSWNSLNRTQNGTRSEGGIDDDDTVLGPFSWVESEFDDVPHAGQPDVWDFDTVVIF